MFQGGSPSLNGTLKIISKQWPFNLSSYQEFLNWSDPATAAKNNTKENENESIQVDWFRQILGIHQLNQSNNQLFQIKGQFLNVDLSIVENFAPEGWSLKLGYEAAQVLLQALPPNYHHFNKPDHSMKPEMNFAMHRNTSITECLIFTMCVAMFFS